MDPQFRLWLVPLTERKSHWLVNPLKPIILQIRKKIKFDMLTKDTDLNVFMQKEYLYGCDCRDNAGFGFWQMAYGSTGKTSGLG